MATDFFGAYFQFPKQKPISARRLIETWSLSTSQPLLFIAKLRRAISMGGNEPDTIGAVFTRPLQVAAVPADEVITPGLSLLLITHL